MFLVTGASADCGRLRVDAASWTTEVGCEASGVSRTDVVPAPVLVLGGIASVQSGAAIATRLFPAVGAGGAVFMRLALSAVLLLPLARPRLRGVARRDLLLVLAFGLVLAAMNFLFYLSIARIPLGVAVTVEFLGPLGVAIAGSRRLLDLMWVLLAALGVALLAGGGGHLDIVGVILAATAGVGWAGYILLSQRVGRVFEGLSGLALALTVGGIAMAPYGIIAGGSNLFHPSVLGKGAAVAILSAAIPFSLELAALRRLRASVFGVLMSLEPAMAAVSGLVFLSQRLRIQEWLAVGAVMVASVGATAQSGSAEPIEPLEAFG
jgi:inner membrane transporter RhtA